MDKDLTVTVRPEEPGDQDAVRRVVLDAFGDDGERVADLVDALTADGSRRVSLVAEVDGKVCGHVQLSRSWIDARERLVEVLVLSPLSVAPDRQGQGIGTTLVRAAVEAAAADRAPALFLEGSPDFYGARGFESGASRGFLRPSVRIPEPAFQVVVLDAHEDWMTGALVYCEAFWTHDCIGLRDPLLADLEARFL
ncbi:MAG: N-acetyltransferase [Nocardioides sp.]|nr:N-acetyltransferase [Nocardioides sp.]